MLKPSICLKFVEASVDQKTQRSSVAFGLQWYLKHEHKGELDNRNIRHWTEPASYSATSGWYHIYAIDIKNFFDMLIEFEFGKDYNFEYWQFRGVMTELFSRNYLDQAQYDYYMSKLPHIATVGEMVDRVEKRGNYQDYISYINSYDGNNNQLRQRLTLLIGRDQQLMPEGQCILDKPKSACTGSFQH